MSPERSRYRDCVIALRQGFAAWFQRDAVYRELAALDARELKDIGITRVDIPAIVAGTFRRGGDGDDNGYGVAHPVNHSVDCATIPP